MKGKDEKEEAQRPAQAQDRQPGIEAQMDPPPKSSRAPREEGKLAGKVALITGGDSGIGRATAIAFAQEGADVAVVYLDEHEDARETSRRVEEAGGRCLLLDGDVGDSAFCRRAVDRAVDELGRLDIVVNNAGEQHPQESLTELTDEQLERTFRTNVFAAFYVTRAALEHLGPGGVILNTTSVTAYRGSPKLLDYSATKGALVAFTRSLSQALVERKIRVNAVAPGPIWTPLIPASFPAEKVATFGSDSPMGRAGEPAEVAPCYVFLASQDASFITGQVLHPNGGEIVNG
jgi:NAD(P)-dependent dehydrogenase (short-subunit alcohol dehydrogenase family)